MTSTEPSHASVTAASWSKTAFNFLFFFLVIYSYYIAKPIRNSLFLEWMGPEQLPYVYMLSAFITLIGAFAMDRILKYVPPVRTVPSVLLFFVALYIVFWWLFRTRENFGATLSFILYLYISFIAVVSVSLFWATCNDTHTPEEGKSAYGYIGIGGILGGLAGGETAKALAGPVGTENLLLISAALLLVSVPLPVMIIRAWHQQRDTQPAALDPETAGGIGSLLRNRHIWFIAGLVFAGTLAGSLLDYQYQGIIKSAGMAKDVRTAYFGRLFSLINLGGIGIHLLLSRLILKKTGIGGLLPLPVIALASAAFLFFRPQLSTVTVCWIVYGALAYSLNQVTRETLYIPVPRALKYRAKFYIDTFIFRSGDTAAAFIILGAGVLQPAMRRPLFLTLGLAIGIIWFLLVIQGLKKPVTETEKGDTDA